MNEKPVLVSGIKPTGDLHIGNYFGAMRQFVELTKAGKYRPFIFVADYHALNTMQNAETAAPRLAGRLRMRPRFWSEKQGMKRFKSP